MLAGDVRPLQADVVRFRRAVPVTRGARSRNSRAPPSTECAPPQVPGPFGILQHRPAGVYRDIRAGSQYSRRAEDRQTGNGAPLASCWLPGLLALEIATAGRAAEYSGRNSRFYSRDEHCQPALGCTRIHGELLKLGIDVGQTTVAKYMVKTKRPPSQGWKIFLVNHADGIASMDLFVVPTISFRLLYGFLILLHARRELLWLGVTAHPTAEWIAQQITEAFGWRNPPRYVVRDRDRVYGARFSAAHAGHGHSGSSDLATLALAKWIC